MDIVLNQPIESFTDKLLYGGQMLLIGMATVFVVLSLLWGCLIIFKLVFHDIPTKRANTVNNSSKFVAPTPVVNEPVITNANNDEIVAVIAAAIAAAESESSGMKFRVVSFRKK